jgi:flagellar hook-basal body complex protein FliE
MTTIPTLIITPSSVSDAYNRNAFNQASGETTSFSTTLDHALRDAAETGHAADSQATKAISGEGNLTEVVTALSKAQLTLQTVTTIRDKVVQAYQDIMKMPI